MALNKRKAVYVDFRDELFTPPIVNRVTGQAATAADTQVDVGVFSGVPMHFYQNGAGTAIAAGGIAVAAAGAGLTVALDATANDGLQLDNGLQANRSPHFYTIGTDPAWYFKAVFAITTVANGDCHMIGLRKSAAHVTITAGAGGVGAGTPVVAGAYSDGIWVGPYTDAGAYYQLNVLNAAGQAATALAQAGYTNTQFIAVKFLVSAAGVVTYRIGESTTLALAEAARDAAAADANAVAYTFDTGDYIIPSFIGVIDATGADPGYIFYKWEHGYQA
jgi:hypothetical protein